jgi:hypothetical protein
MDKNSIKQALELLQNAQAILDDAFLADSDGAAIAMANEDLAQVIKFVGELIAPVIAPPAAWLNDEKIKAMPTDIETIRTWAETALGSLSCKRVNDAISELKTALEHIGPDSRDAAVIKRAIDRLTEIAREITEVEDLLGKTDFSFGNIRVLLARPVEVPWDDPPRLN